MISKESYTVFCRLQNCRQRRFSSTGGIWGIGFGGEVYDGVLLNYSYNLSSNVALNTFGSHQFTLGVRLFKDIIKTQNIEERQGSGIESAKK